MEVHAPLVSGSLGPARKRPQGACQSQNDHFECDSGTGKPDFQVIG